MANAPQVKADQAAEERMCFVVMPISEPDGYVKGHFKHVYEDIIRPACRQAGFAPFRGDEVKQSNLIHLDILQKLIEIPMAVCDLSGRNPNVLFELALRQAFDKPVALIQEVGTPQIFDISPLRYTEYRKERIYHEVLDDQKAIAAAIDETFKSHGTGRSINSIVKLLALSKPAALPDIGSHEAKEDVQKIILAELGQLRDEVRLFRRDAHLAARTATRRDAAPFINTIMEHCARTEALLASDDAPSLQNAEMELAACRNRLMHVLHERPNESWSIRDREMLENMDHRVKFLEMELQRKIQSGHSKKKE